MSTNNVPRSGEKSKDKASRFKCYSMAELAAMDLRVEYLLRGALVAGVPGVVGGLPKTCKSSVMLDMAVSLATGTPWLGHFECVKKSRVVYAIGEGGLIFGKDVVRRVAESKGFDFADIDGLWLCQNVPILSSQAEIDELVANAKDFGAEVFMCDPLYLMLGVQAAMASNVFAMGAMLQGLLRACQDAGLTLLLIHHFKRSVHDTREPDLSDLSQAGASEFAGQWLLLGRQRPYDEDDAGHHSLTLRLGSRAGHATRWALDIEEGTPEQPGGRFWRAEVSTLADVRERQAADKAAKKEARRQHLEGDMAKILARMNGLWPATKSKIKEYTAVSGKYLDEAVAELLATGHIVPSQVRRDNGQSYAGYDIVA